MYRLSDDTAAVVTIDVITPLVDDPAQFGAIAAANSLSDVYAMGGEGLLAVSFLSVPSGFPLNVAQQILVGAANKAMEAGAPILGGHTVEAKDLLFGLAVVGRVHPDQTFANHRLRAGDCLVLTKPLGTGTLTTAFKRDRLTADAIAPAVASMLQLNAAAVPILRAHGVIAATDITGFGLLGHAAELAAASRVQIAFDAQAPAFPHAREMLEAGVVTRGNQRNLDYVRSLGTLEGDPEPLVLDPQTSGGLFFGVKAERLRSVLADLHAAGFAAAACVGNVSEGTGLRLSPA